MKINFTGQFGLNPQMLLRRCGYGQVRTREVSYTKRLSGAEYPRFHAYIEESSDGFTVNLHIDQKKPSYGSNTAHSGEYEGELVEREADRIKQTIESMKT